MLTGTAGAGKTAVAREVGELLWRCSERYAVLDLDAFGEVGPLAEGEFNSSLIAQNLASVWPNFRAHGVDRLVLARVLSSADEFAAYQRALVDVDIKVVRLVAPVAAVRSRLALRETGVKRPFLLRLAEELDGQLEETALEDFVVENSEHRAVTDVAIEILSRLEWPTPKPPTHG
jgi:hypothetical protein